MTLKYDGQGASIFGMTESQSVIFISKYI